MMRAPTAPAAKADIDFADCDDSNARPHPVDHSTDPYEAFEIAFHALVSGPVYVPKNEAMP